MKSLYPVPTRLPRNGEPELLSCPFCGTQALIRSDGATCKVGCFNPACGIRPKASSTCETTCFNNWNRRSPVESVPSAKSVETR